MNKEQKKEITAIYHKYFNGSMIEFIDSIYQGEKSNYIKLYFTKDAKDLPYQDKGNDLFNIYFNITEITENNFKINFTGTSYRLKPKSRFMFCEYKIILTKNTQGKFDTIKATFKNFIENLTKSLYKDYMAGNLLENDMQLVKHNFNFKQIENILTCNLLNKQIADLKQKNIDIANIDKQSLNDIQEYEENKLSIKLLQKLITELNPNLNL